MGEIDAARLLLKVYSEQVHTRALLLAPSFQEAEYGCSLFEALSTPPQIFSARDVEDDLSVFTDSSNAVLALAGRYDGIDLPGDHCRLLIMWESPSAVGALERHQREHWKLGPLLRRRERTRLIQGLGRCTRDATDWAVVLLLGQSMVDAVCNPVVVDGLPGEIQREIHWGRTQGAIGRDDPEALIQMILGVMNDPAYRSEANESMEEVETGTPEGEPKTYRESARHEVAYSSALWAGDYSEAYRRAKEAADAVSGSDLAGYRAWWLYLASLAARLDGNDDGASDCLGRARAIGVNSGFISHVLRSQTGKGAAVPEQEEAYAQAEAIWSNIEKLGWNGPKFGKAADAALEQLRERKDTTKFHMGLEALGGFLGAEAIRPTDDGAPDVVWFFPDVFITFEAKAGKDADNPLCKRDLIQAKSHPDWVKAHRRDSAGLRAIAVVIPPDLALGDVAKPYVEGVTGISVSDLEQLAKEVVEALRAIRTEFSGKEYSATKEHFLRSLKQRSLLLEDLGTRFLSLLV
jgi:hypothetical protein